MSMSRELEILERIANLLRSEARVAAQDAGLQPIQLDILDYLDQCNRYSDTPAGVTDYLSLTKGTVSQSILRLEEKGLVERRTDDLDHRVSHLTLTTQGRRNGRSAGRRSFEKVLEVVRNDGSGSLADELESVLRAFQRIKGQRSFGVCHSCRFFEQPGPKSYRCGFTQERLFARDIGLICREHQRPARSCETKSGDEK